MDPMLRFRACIALAALSGLAFAATLVWPDWIELLLRFDPDHGDGSAERGIVLAIVGVSALLMSALAWQARPLHLTAAGRARPD